MEETHLCHHWQLSMKHGSSQDEVRVNVPKLSSVSAKDLKSPVSVFEENPGLCESWRGKQYVWSVSRLSTPGYTHNSVSPWNDTMPTTMG
jgi:hypothetical protein